MTRKINQETIIMFGFFVIVWILIRFIILIFDPIISFGYNSKPTLAWIFWIFLMLPAYITNIITNIDKLNLFDSNYFWSVHPASNILFAFFWLFGCLYFSSILTLLSGDNERIKNIIWKFHFCFFTYALTLESVRFYFRYREDPNVEIVMGSGNLLVLLGYFIFVATNIYILTRIKKNVNFEFLKIAIKKYVFLISEFLLVLFVALIFNDYLLSPDANVIDRVTVPLEVSFIGFFFFLGIQLIRIRFKEG